MLEASFLEDRQSPLGSLDKLPSSNDIGAKFVWRCIRDGMWRDAWFRWVAYRHAASATPIVCRWRRKSPMDIMQAAAQMKEKQNA